jgi:hypothetical protein
VPSAEPYHGADSGNEDQRERSRTRNADSWHRDPLHNLGPGTAVPPESKHFLQIRIMTYRRYNKRALAPPVDSFDDLESDR